MKSIEVNIYRIKGKNLSMHNVNEEMISTNKNYVQSGKETEIMLPTSCKSRTFAGGKKDRNV